MYNDDFTLEQDEPSIEDFPFIVAVHTSFGLVELLGFDTQEAANQAFDNLSGRVGTCPVPLECIMVGRTDVDHPDRVWTPQTGVYVVPDESDLMV